MNDSKNNSKFFLGLVVFTTVICLAHGGMELGNIIPIDGHHDLSNNLYTIWGDKSIQEFHSSVMTA
jgi:hypothetical protein